MTKKIMIFLVTVILLISMLPTRILAQDPVQCQEEYTVQRGDWLSKIAEKYYGDILAYDLIVQANNLQSGDAYTDIDNPDLIEPGWTLCIPGVSGQATTTPDLTGTVWQWQQTLMNNGDEFVPANPANYTIVFKADGTVAVQADCNQVSGTYTLNDSQITIELGPSTMAACPEGSLGDQFVSNLSGANIFFFDGDNLMIDLMFDSGTKRFSPQSNELVGTDWTVIGYNNGRGGVVSVIIGTELTAAFGADGTVSGSAGCNNYSAGFETDGNAFTIGLPISNMMACDQPEGIMEQEQEFLAALPTAATYQITGNRLEMRTAEGSIVATFERAASLESATDPVDELMNKVTLVQHNYDPKTKEQWFTCASSGQGLNGVAPDPEGPRFVGPNSMDFDLWGVVGLFKIDPDSTITFVPQETGGKFVDPTGVEHESFTLDETLGYFASGDAVWIGTHGEPGRIEDCDPTSK